MSKRYIYRFVVVGVVGFIFNYGLLQVFSSLLGINHVVSEAVAMLFSVHLTFLLHDRWTYAGQGSHKYLWGIGKRYASYLASNAFSAMLTVVLFGVFAQVMPHVVALGSAAMISMVWNFTLNKVLIWRKSNKENSPAAD